MTEKEIIDTLRIGTEIEITICYNGASSMTVVLGRFFPCRVIDLTILLKKEMLKYEPDLGTANKISKLQRKYAKNLEKLITVSSKWKGITE